METKEFIRDKSNKGALLNIDNKSLEAYKKNREFLRKTKSYESRLEKLEKSIDTLMTLVVEALERKQA